MNKRDGRQQLEFTDKGRTNRYAYRTTGSDSILVAFDKPNKSCTYFEGKEVAQTKGERWIGLSCIRVTYSNLKGDL